MSLMRRVGRVFRWGCAIILVKCNVLLHIRRNWIFGDNGGIWFLPLWGARKVLTIYFTSVKIISPSKKNVLFRSTYTGTSLFGSGQDWAQ